MIHRGILPPPSPLSRINQVPPSSDDPSITVVPPSDTRGGGGGFGLWIACLIGRPPPFRLAPTPPLRPSKCGGRGSSEETPTPSGVSKWVRHSRRSSNRELITACRLFCVSEQKRFFLQTIALNEKKILRHALSSWQKNMLTNTSPLPSSIFFLSLAVLPFSSFFSPFRLFLPTGSRSSQRQSHAIRSQGSKPAGGTRRKGKRWR